ncbi:MAG: hypothetical protein JWM95_2711, partial [Gemmatimonadetes bacterium]|nr:hypothetical protein [Gemmatimonadota bacterium]
ETLVRAPWPHNLRQLDAVIQRIMIEAAASASSELSLVHCPRDVMLAIGVAASSRQMPTLEVVRERMKELKSVGKTAASLGISRWTVNRYLRDDPHANT